MKYLLIILLFLSTVTNATDYFISNSGNDLAAGTSPGSAWKKLYKLNSIVLTAGDRVFLERGSVFYEALPVNQSGNPENHIIFSNYGFGRNPIVSGFTVIPSWNLVSGLYEYALNLPGNNCYPTNGRIKCNVVLVDGIFQKMGRYPKINAVNGGYLTYTGHKGVSQLTSSELSNLPDVAGGEIVIKRSAWNLDRGLVIAQTSNTINYSFFGAYHTINFVSDGFGFFIQNHPNTCMQQNEWCYDKGKLKIFSSRMPTVNSVKASTIRNLVDLTNKSYIDFVSIDFEGANEKGFLFDNTNNILIDSCSIKYSGQDGIYAANSGSTNNKVSNSTFDYSNNCAIDGGEGSSSRWTVTNNYITNTGSIPGIGLNGDYPNYTAINFMTGGSSILYNYIYNTGYTAIHVRGVGNVSHNFIDTYCTVVQDGGAIYSIYEAGQKTITYNTILNGKGNFYGTDRTDLWANGIYMDDGSKDGNISYNVIGHISFRGIMIHNSANFTITNNTIYDCGQSPMALVRDNYGGVPLVNITINNNTLFQRNAPAGSMQRYLTYYYFDGPGQSTIPLSIKWNNNWYASPAVGANTNNLYVRENATQLYRTPAQFKAAYSTKGQQDRTYPKFVTSKNDSLFYNNTNGTINLITGRQWKDINGNISDGTVTLTAYQAKLLFDVGAASRGQ